MSAIRNFGRNVRFVPGLVLTPRDEHEVVACLDRHRDRTIRAIGRLHSWSEVAVGRDVVLDLRHLNGVTIGADRDGRPYADIGAGCTIDRVLAALRTHGYTLPTVGIIGKQTIAGAIGTATHGSGCASLSHYVSAVRAAAYDHGSGRARTYEWTAGEALRAARCGIGCTGIVLSVRMPVVPEYLIEEQTRWFASLEEVLECEAEFPRLQCYLIPWSWHWFAQLRRPIDAASGRRSGAFACLGRRVGVMVTDAGFNGLIRLAARLRWWRAMPWLYRGVFRAIALSGLRLTDRSSRMLMMRHDLYVHVETEIFVPAPHVSRAAAFLEWVLRRCGGERPAMPAMLTGDDFGRNVTGDLEALAGRYVHDYPITVRRVLRDDTLISMTSGDEADAWYAFSLVTYRTDLAPFLAMAGLVARAMASAYGARPHWGKINPLDAASIAALYPELPRFRAHCASVDPGRVFVNDFTRGVLDG